MLLKTVASIFGFSIVLASSGEKFFRRDYTYSEEYDAFYKLHWGEGSSDWEGAFVTCNDEGGHLFYPKSDEWTIVKNLTDSPDDIGEVFVGVRDEFGIGDFVSTEGHFMPQFTTLTIQEGAESQCIVMSTNTGSFKVRSCKQKKPFICKKEDDESCPTVDSSYVYSKASKKCYKVNKRPKRWIEAHHTCLMEGGMLLTSAEDMESAQLTKRISSNQYYYIGIRRMFPQSDFFNLQGVMTELNDCSSDNQCYKNCKAVYLNSNNDCNYQSQQKIVISSHDCNMTRPFICEMGIKH